MLGWMIVFLVVGIVIGSLVMSSCINDYVKPVSCRGAAAFTAL